MLPHKMKKKTILMCETPTIIFIITNCFITIVGQFVWQFQNQQRIHYNQRVKIYAHDSG